MIIHKESKGTFIVLAIFIIASYLFCKWMDNSTITGIILALDIFLFVTVVQFFRNPTREVPALNIDIVYTPADGKIVVIEKVIETEYIKAECWMVSVFMSPINVHANRNPISGKVEYLKYHPGKYLAAWNPKASTENERFTTAYQTEHGTIVIRQIAGALARRIVNYLKSDQDVVQGQEMGFIKFGSRVDIFLPLSANIEVELDQVVRSPKDIIARF